MVSLMMASPVVSAAAFGWVAAFVVLAAGFAGLMSWANTPKQRTFLVAVGLVILIAILITGTARADDFACPGCGCVWWWC